MHFPNKKKLVVSESRNAWEPELKNKKYSSNRYFNQDFSSKNNKQ